MATTDLTDETQDAGDVLRDVLGLGPDRRLTVARDAHELVRTLVTLSEERPELRDAVDRLLQQGEHFELERRSGAVRLVLRNPTYVDRRGEMHCRVCGT